MKQENKDYAIELINDEIKFGFYTKEDMLLTIGDMFLYDDDVEYDNYGYKRIKKLMNAKQ